MKTKTELKKMENARHLLEAPAPQVVGELLEHISEASQCIDSLWLLIQDKLTHEDRHDLESMVTPFLSENVERSRNEAQASELTNATGSIRSLDGGEA